MANSDKNILITPNKNASGTPEIALTGFGASTISIKPTDSTTGNLLFENSGKRLFSIDTVQSSGSIFKVINNTSKIPLFNVDSSGNVKLTPQVGTTNILGNGITLPSYTSNNLPEGEEGLLVYDSTLKLVRIFSKNKWVLLGTPSIITGGLCVRLDAGDIRSYPGNGASWYDLSGFNNNVSWSSTPDYDYRGFFRFNGSSHNGTITNNASLNTNAEQTLMLVIRHNYNSGRRNPWNQAYAGFGTWTHEQGENISWYFGDGGGDNSPYLGHGSPTTPRGRWNILATVRTNSTYQWYYDGVSTGSFNHGYGVLTDSSANITIGNGYAGYWQGDMAMVLCYRRALSSAEILQNYNAIRIRYPAND